MPFSKTAAAGREGTRRPAFWKQARRGRRTVFWIAAFGLTVGLWAGATQLLAHQPSKIDHNTVIRVQPNGAIRVHFQEWWGSLHAHFLRCEHIDTDKNKRITPEEKNAFRKKKAETLRRGLTLKVDGKRRPLQLLSSVMVCDGDRCVPEDASIKLILIWEPPSERVPSRIEFFDDAEVPLMLAGNNTITLELPGGVSVKAQKARTLWEGEYITGGTFWLEGKPRATGGEEESAGATGKVATALSDGETAEDAGNGRSRDPFEKLLDRFTSAETKTLTLVVALVVAFWLGAAHALSPGHGKAMVAGYLVGSKGRVRDAVVLGLIVTFTHIFSVVLLGLLMLYLSSLFRQEQVFPWMTFVSGALIFLIGLSLYLRAWRGLADRNKGSGHEHTHGFWIFKHSHSHALPHVHDHDHAHPHDHAHDHDHAHPHDHVHDHDHAHSHDHAHPHAHAHAHEPLPSAGAVEEIPYARVKRDGVAAGAAVLVAPPVSSGAESDPSHPGVRWRDLLILGVSGGMVPCPSALVVLLSSIAFEIAHIGLLLILAFSLGLAMVLVGIGVFMVVAGSVSARLGFGGGRIAKVLPFISGTAVTLVGVSIALKGLDNLGMIDVGGWIEALG